MPQVGASKRKTTSLTEETSLDLPEGVLRCCQQSRYVWPRNPKPRNNNSRSISNAQAQNHEPLEDEGADRVLHSDRVSDRGRDRGLSRTSASSDISESVTKE